MIFLPSSGTSFACKRNQIKKNDFKFASRSSFGIRLLESIRAMEGSTAETFKKSRTIYFPGEPAKKIYLIREGAVRLSRVYESGEETLVSLLREDSLFGVLSFTDDPPTKRKYHATALTSVVVESAPVISIKKAIASNTNIGFLLLQGLSNRVMQTESIIESLTHKDISSKLVNYLLLLCKDFGVKEGARIIINLHISHQEIADAIGSTRVTITKLIGELKCLGLLAVHRKKIIILDHMKLANRLK